MNPYRAISVEIVHHGYASFVVLALHLEHTIFYGCKDDFLGSYPSEDRKRCGHRRFSRKRRVMQIEALLFISNFFAYNFF
jgi:hypothetical protein